MVGLFKYLENFIYPKYLNRKAWASSQDSDQMPQNMAMKTQIRYYRTWQWRFRSDTTEHGTEDSDQIPQKQGSEDRSDATEYGSELRSDATETWLWRLRSDATETWQWRQIRCNRTWRWRLLSDATETWLWRLRSDATETCQWRQIRCHRTWQWRLRADATEYGNEDLDLMP